VVRSYAFADLIGRQRGLHYDTEALFSATVLHDLGLTDMAPVKQRFEVEGADAAKDFLARHGMDDRRAEIVWEAIALHTIPAIAQRKGPEVALCQLGVIADLDVLPAGLIERKALDAFLEQYPRPGLEQELLQSLIDLYEKSPIAATSHAVADACELRVSGFVRPNLCRKLIQRPASGDPVAAWRG
jgi:hypothetical protein